MEPHHTIHSIPTTTVLPMFCVVCTLMQSGEAHFHYPTSGKFNQIATWDPTTKVLKTTSAWDDENEYTFEELNDAVGFMSSHKPGYHIVVMAESF